MAQKQRAKVHFASGLGRQVWLWTWSPAGPLTLRDGAGESNGLARASHEGSTTDLLTERLLELSQPDLQTVLRCLQPNRPGGNIKVSHLRPSGLVESRISSASWPHGYLDAIGPAAVVQIACTRRGGPIHAVLRAVCCIRCAVGG